MASATVVSDLPRSNFAKGVAPFRLSSIRASRPNLATLPCWHTGLLHHDRASLKPCR
jgi:hypothetical protein